MTQERIQKKTPSKQEEAEIEEVIATAVDEEAEKLKADTDELLDEIDSLLEENAEEFVRNYVQKGGE